MKELRPLERSILINVLKSNIILPENYSKGLFEHYSEFMRVYDQVKSWSKEMLDYFIDYAKCQKVDVGEVSLCLTGDRSRRNELGLNSDLDLILVTSNNSPFRGHIKSERENGPHNYYLEDIGDKFQEIISKYSDSVSADFKAVWELNDVIPYLDKMPLIVLSKRK